MSLVEITEKSHNVKLELLYAKDSNFTGKIIYKNPLCFLHSSAIPLLDKAIFLAEQQGYTFKIFDAFRPKSAAQLLWDFCPNPIYVADPKNGSHHTRGVAIDLTLVDKATGQDVDMGTPFDDFSEKSHHSTVITPEISKNRYLLLGIMLTAGWDFYNSEWWHYQMFSPRNFPLIDDDYGIM